MCSAISQHAMPRVQNPIPTYCRYIVRLLECCLHACIPSDEAATPQKCSSYTTWQSSTSPSSESFSPNRIKVPDTVKRKLTSVMQTFLLQFVLFYKKSAVKWSDTSHVARQFRLYLPFLMEWVNLLLVFWCFPRN